MNKPLAVLIVSMLLILSTACSKPDPYLTDTTTVSKIGDSGKLTQNETRRLLDSNKIAGSNSAIIELRALVTKIDPQARKLTLQTTSGRPVDMIAGPEVRNFNQIKVGDRVEVAYIMSLDFEVRNPTAEEQAVMGETLGIAGRAPLGSKPAAGAMATTKAVATVQKIDKSNGTIGLKNDKTGSVEVITVRHPENLNFVSEGDKVVLTFKEALATSVTTVQ